MPSNLESRVAALEADDDSPDVFYACSACGYHVPGDEAGYAGGTLPPCTQGKPHSPIPAGPIVRVVWTD